MTAFLYISPTCDAVPPARRVDFGNIASLFGAESEPMPHASRLRDALRFTAALFFLLLAAGDTVLFARPDTLTTCAVLGRQIITGPGEVVSL